MASCPQKRRKTWKGRGSFIVTAHRERDQPAGILLMDWCWGDQESEPLLQRQSKKKEAVFTPITSKEDKEDIDKEPEHS